MKSTRQFKCANEFKRRAYVMLDPVAWLASYEASSGFENAAISMGEEILKNNHGDLKLALAAETEFRAELIVAYLLANPDINEVARSLITEVGSMLDQIDAERSGQH